ncbi:MAG: TetM/TetW/TetO/TetS family tetracycline resistance ribosomal protection protein [Bacteroidales bacterium]|nr:TetM/TetW/TetO/TetS family tetracycline resistance ribosomal protection protein [Bacteroidales bacterium]
MNRENGAKRRLTVGILAHVDAGKTTLSEGLLYRFGELRRLGRVDHGDTLLDSNQLERARGITIFSKMAILRDEELEISLLDTPGHVDFSAEMERTLSVLDYGILVISGTDGVQGHTETLWSLLKQYGVPVFLFVNKMDLPGTDREKILEELRARLDEGIQDFTAPLGESAALCDEALMEEYLEKGEFSPQALTGAIARRGIFPCYFGSALKLQGVDELIDGLHRYTRQPAAGEAFGARVFKVAQDERGARLTYLKVTGGCLKVKDTLRGRRPSGGEWSEKADQLRVYSGPRYELAGQILPGQVCAVTGLDQACPGEGLGAEGWAQPPVLEPVLSYKVELPEGIDPHTALTQLRQLEQEEPQLRLRWQEGSREIQIQLMGEVQKEILASLVRERFGWQPGFGQGSILYKEKIAKETEGVGHFEPLRHYAEVHLLMRPGKPGSGLVFRADCREEVLDKNWQRLVLTHLAEKTHLGVLTGSPLTDTEITLIGGRAHLKHTEGGDFRQATYRAVRQGLRTAGCLLLEPWYQFRLELPAENLGRAMTDIQQMGGRFSAPESQGETALLEGEAPVAGLREYQAELTRYTRGRGRLNTALKGYEPCHNAQEIIQALGYDPDADTENPADSVFCSHGAGHTVKWDQVRDHMHLDTGWGRPKEPEFTAPPPREMARRAGGYISSLAQDKELMAIFERTYGPLKKDPRRAFRPVEKPAAQAAAPQPQGPEYLLVDGYNIIFAWPDLKELAQQNLEAARQRLTDILCNYQGFARCEVILVFDAYKVKGNPGTVEKLHNISVVYTKEAETADMYIEKVTHQLGRKHRVRVASSDGLEQIIILGAGAMRLSARAFREEVDAAEKAIRSYLAGEE